MFLAPEWDRSCDDCKRWIYKDDESVPMSERGTVMQFGGKPMVRDLKLIPPPCYRCEKIPESVRANIAPGVDGSMHAVEPEERHRQAIDFHLECRAVNSWPDDALVRRHAALIEPMIRRAERRPLEVLTATMASLASRMR